MTQPRGRGATRLWGAVKLAAIAGVTLACAAVQAAEAIPAAVLACLPLTDGAQRLACFDREVGRYHATPAQGFGVTGEQTRWTAPAEHAAAKEVKEVSSKIAATATRADGAIQFTLDNGQIWVQAHPEYMDGVSAGDSATIKLGIGGTFYLYNAHHYATRVQRVK